MNCSMFHESIIADEGSFPVIYWIDEDTEFLVRRESSCYWVTSNNSLRIDLNSCECWQGLEYLSTGNFLILNSLTLYLFSCLHLNQISYFNPCRLSFETFSTRFDPWEFLHLVASGRRSIQKEILPQDMIKMKNSRKL